MEEFIRSEIISIFESDDITKVIPFDFIFAKNKNNWTVKNTQNLSVVKKDENYFLNHFLKYDPNLFVYDFEKKILFNKHSNYFLNLSNGSTTTSLPLLVGTAASVVDSSTAPTVFEKIRKNEISKISKYFGLLNKFNLMTEKVNDQEMFSQILYNLYIETFSSFFTLENNLKKIFNFVHNSNKGVKSLFSDEELNFLLEEKKENILLF